MSVADALALFRRLPKLPSGQIFNASGRAGPRRLAALAVLALATLTVVIVVVASGQSVPIVSQDARLKPSDPLPGGLHSTPEQDALALSVADEQAARALKTGVSYTPAMAPSQVAAPVPPEQLDLRTVSPRRAPAFVGRTRATVAVTPPAPIDVTPEPQMRPTQIAATPAETQAQLQAYTSQINNLFAQWGGRAPRTDIVLPPAQLDSAGADAPVPPAASVSSRARATSPAQPASPRTAEQEQPLIPAGRGIFAHPVLALSSDETSPAVFQADSGPIAGDRMIGTFSKQSNRLIIHIGTIIHRGEEIACDGVVIAPDTMEASVATGVDEHYVARFVLPAAAAFVAGLGQAIEQTSNSTAVLSPFGGATTTNHLNIQQQLGVAAGTAAAQAGAIINQEAPRGPTITLDANVAVGVMFLSNVRAGRS